MNHGFRRSPLLLLALLIVVGTRAHASTATKPNIIFILADDIAQGDLGCYGQKRIKTPHLDRMAAEGTRYTQAYAGTSACAPSRTSLMTGLHVGHTLAAQQPDLVAKAAGLMKSARTDDPNWPVRLQPTRMAPTPNTSR